MVSEIAHLLDWLQLLACDRSGPNSLDRKLSTVMSYRYSDETYPWPTGTCLRLLLTSDYLLFVQQSVLARTVIRLRIARRDLLDVRLGYFPVPDDTNSLGEFLIDWALFGDVEARQIQRHNQLVRAVAGPQQTEGLLIHYRDTLRYDGQGTFVGIQPACGSGVSLRESAYHLWHVIHRSRFQP